MTRLSSCSTGIVASASTSGASACTAAMTAASVDGGAVNVATRTAGGKQNSPPTPNPPHLPPPSRHRPTPWGGREAELTASRELRRCPPGLPPPGQRRGELSADADEKHRCLW